MSSGGKDEAEATAAFVATGPTGAATPLVFASPHSGRFYPPRFLAASKLSTTAIRRSEDAYVDALLSPAAVRIPFIRGTHARAYIDLNRNADELDASMFIGGLPHQSARRTVRVQSGLGALARIVGEGQEIYRTKLPASEAADRISEIHEPYHRALEGLVAEARLNFGYCALIDWHSMPSAALSAGRQVDVVLGDRFGLSCAPQLTSVAERELEVLGLKVQRNTPFAGGYTTERYGEPLSGRHALQIELNRALYLEENSLALLPGASELQRVLEVFALRLKEAIEGPLEAHLLPVGAGQKRSLPSPAE